MKAGLFAFYATKTGTPAESAVEFFHQIIHGFINIFTEYGDGDGFPF